MQDLLTALALILVIEGLLLCLLPETMKRMVVDVLTLPTNVLRIGGLVAAAVGVFVVWLIRGGGA